VDIGLVLGGGGARGLAHIGVLRALEELGHRPVAIAGCSIGAVIGALAAAGRSPEYIEDLARSLRRRDLIEIGKSGAIFGNEKIGKYIEPHLPATFEELEIPLKVTAVDCQRGQLVVLGTGELVSSVLASSAIPGLLSPVFHGDRIFLDGGVLNNLPVDVVRTMTEGPVVAVDVAVPHNRELNFQDEQSLRERISGLFDRTHQWLTIELFLKAFDVPVRLITQSLLALHPPEVLIRPRLDPHFRLEDFDRLDEALEAGDRAAKEALQEVGRSGG